MLYDLVQLVIVFGMKTVNFIVLIKECQKILREHVRSSGVGACSVLGISILDVAVGVHLFSIMMLC